MGGRDIPFEFDEMSKRKFARYNAQIELHNRKAAAFDKLIDDAATICAICASEEWSMNDAGDGFSDLSIELALEAYSEVFDERASTGRFIPVAEVHEICAETEARLRNGECWHLITGKVES